MPLLEQDRVFTYTGNGIAISFVYGCKIFDSADLKVKIDGVLQTINTDYTLTGVGDAGGGSVDFLSAPADQADIEIYTDLAYKRDTDYVYGGDFKADAVDNDLDRIMMLIQQLRRETKRAIKAPMSETDDKVISEVAGDRVNKLLGFGASGELVVQAITDLSQTLSTVGFGLELSGEDLHLAPPVKVVNSFPYTITASDHIILVDGTGTINFPQQSAVSSATIAKGYILISISGTATLAPYAGDSLPVTSLASGATISYIGNGGTIWRERKVVNAFQADTLKDNATINNPTINNPTINGGVTLNGNAWPSFSVHRDGIVQSIAYNTPVKIEWTTEEFDTNNNFDNVTNYRFTPTVEGKYVLTTGIVIEFGDIGGSSFNEVYVYKNGTAYKGAKIFNATNYISMPLSVVVDANGSSDYFEVYVVQRTNASGLSIIGSTVFTFFMGSRVG